MTINDYQKECLRTASGASNWAMMLTHNPEKDKINYPLLLNGLMGLNGESGECIDILKKHLFQGHELDLEHLAKELGDVAWYLSVSATAIGYDLETIFEMNVNKLYERYPEGFDSELSQHRREEDI